MTDRPCYRCHREGVQKVAKNMCGQCYQRQRLRDAPECSVRGCTEHQRARGLCVAHYRAKLRAEKK